MKLLFTIIVLLYLQTVFGQTKKMEIDTIRVTVSMTSPGMSIEKAKIWEIVPHSTTQKRIPGNIVFEQALGYLDSDKHRINGWVVSSPHYSN